MPKIFYIELLWVASLWVGCRPAEPVNLSSTAPPPDLARIDLLNDSSGELIGETWSVHRVRGFKMGHQWTRDYKIKLGDAPAERRIVVDELLIPRFGIANNQVLRAAAVYDARGRLVEMEYELQSQDQRRRLVAKVVDSRLFVLRINGSQRQLTQQDWNPDNGGFFAIERSLTRSPMQPGERRVVQAWLPLIDQPQAFRLEAEDGGAEVGVSEARVSEVGVSEARVSEDGVSEARVSEARVSEDGVSEDGVSEAETPKLRNSETPKFRSSETPKLRNSETPKFRSSETPKLRNSETPKFRSSETPKHRNTEPPKHRNTETLPITVTLADQPADVPAGLRLWVDRDGVIQRRWRRTLDQTTELADKTAALQPNEPLKFDIALDVRIPFADAPADIDTSTHATYRVQLTGVSPALMIPQGGYQSVRALDPHTAIVDVHTDLTQPAADATGPGDNENTNANTRASEHASQRASERASADVSERARKLETAVPDATAVQGNYWLEVKDPAIVKFVRRAVGTSAARDAVIEKLRKAVGAELRQTTLGNTLSTAAGALRAKAGDCTEHAMLLAAACRVCQIPARVAVGVIYQPSSRSFVYHMWTEVWNGHEWQPIDAMAETPIAPANRIKLLDSDLSTESDYALVAPFAPLIGNLKIAKP